MRFNQFLSVAVAAVLVAGAATAQDEAAPTVTETEAVEWSPTWPDAEIGKLANMLSGTWKTTEPVKETGQDADGSVHLVMQVGPVPAAGQTMLYSEVSRSDEMGFPYRQTLYALYRYKGKIRLRTYELRWPKENTGVLVGLWAAPSYFPELTLDDVIATLDVQLEPTAGGFAGATPYPYPTGTGGAVEMTSKVELSANRMTTADRGLDANGAVVWGAEASGQWVWDKIENPVKVTEMDSGVIALDFVRPEGEGTKAGDRVFVHYSGWIESGMQFDSSRPRGQPFELGFPAPGRLIEGWNIGLADMTIGTKRRLIIPSAAGYGVQGQPRASIPSNADLYFEVELMDKQSPTETPAEPVDEHEGHDHP